ncbi:hypothetical protein Goari_022497, partial [Gossypium aridum]|nr:hypothetical protein [Gossypium aridum]
DDKRPCDPKVRVWLAKLSDTSGSTLGCKGHTTMDLLGFRSNSPIIACSSIAETDTETSSTAFDRPVPVNPVYVPTPANRDTRTPHSGTLFPSKCLESEKVVLPANQQGGRNEL